MKLTFLITALITCSLNVVGQNISGEWMGEGFQPGSIFPNSKVIFKLTQDGNSISGTKRTYAINNPDIYCLYSIQGTFEGNIFRFIEGAPIDESNINNISCCRGVQYELILKGNNNLTLEGSGKGPNCPQNNINVSKINPCEGIVNRIDFHVNGVPVIPQPNHYTCWAASAAMMHWWRQKKNNNSISDALYEIEGGNYKFHQTFLISNDIFIISGGSINGGEPKELYLDKMGLQVFEYPSSMDQFEFYLKQFGPILLLRHQDCRNPKYNGRRHAMIMTGIHGDGTPECTYFDIIDPWAWDKDDRKTQVKEEQWTYEKLFECRWDFVHYPLIQQQIELDKVVNDSFSNLPEMIDDLPIKYQSTIYVQNREITIYPFDNEQEDGDIVSININGVWVRDYYTLKNMNTNPNREELIKCSLNPGNSNYVISKAWNVGSVAPNTLTIKINDGISTQEVFINSDIGLSGGIRIVCNK